MVDWAGKAMSENTFSDRSLDTGTSLFEQVGQLSGSLYWGPFSSRGVTQLESFRPWKQNRFEFSRQLAPFRRICNRLTHSFILLRLSCRWSSLARASTGCLMRTWCRAGLSADSADSLVETTLSDRILESIYTGICGCILVWVGYSQVYSQ